MHVSGLAAGPVVEGGIEGRASSEVGGRALHVIDVRSAARGGLRLAAPRRQLAHVRESPNTLVGLDFELPSVAVSPMFEPGSSRMEGMEASLTGAL